MDSKFGYTDKEFEDLMFAITLHQCAADVETKARAIMLMKDTLGIMEDTDD